PVPGINEYVSAIDVLPGDSILIGTPQGVILYHNGNRFPFCNDRDVNTTDFRALGHYENRVVLGSFNKGLFITDLKGNHLWRITKSHGLSSNNIYSVTFDKQGNLWASTGFYLDRISFSGDFSFSKVETFSKTQGIHSAEGNLNGLLCDSKNNLWEGTNDGVYRISADDAERSINPPVIVMRKLTLFSAPITNKKYFDSLSRFNQLPVNLKLPHNQNHLTFEFQGISLTDPEQVKYQYYIKGLDNSFSEPSSQNSVIYSGLPSGKYSFIARAINSKGTLSSNVIVYDFEITTPFYRTAVFKILLGFVLIGLGVIIRTIISRVRQKRIKFIEELRANEQEKMRKRATEDFHDELGNRLTRISVLAEVLKKRAHEKSEIEPIIEQIKENSLALYNGTRDVIWSLSNTDETFFELLTRIKEFAVDLFHETGIDVEVDGIQETFKKNRLPADFSRNLVMIAKEALNNILKHAKAGKVIFKIRLRAGDNVEMAFVDDGKGFDPAFSSEGNGIKNIKLRVQRINGNVFFQSGEPTGTVLNLEFRLP
ncbi:MAG TPA: triple tyrosine motif-containing protein, partial [Chitinophagaceae bacterium]